MTWTYYDNQHEKSTEVADAVSPSRDSFSTHLPPISYRLELNNPLAADPDYPAERLGGVRSLEVPDRLAQQRIVMFL